MYYKERCNEGEMRTCRIYMQTVVQKLTQQDPHETLLEWGQLIKEEFEADNLFITAAEEETGFLKIAKVVTEVGRSVASMQEKIVELTAIVGQQQSAMKEMQVLIRDMNKSKSEDLTPQSPVVSSQPARRSSPRAAPASRASSSAVPAVQPISSALPPLLEDDPRPHSEFLAMPASGIYKSLKHYGSQPSYIIDRKQRACLRTIEAWFDAFATEDELQMLADRTADEGKKCKLVEELEQLVRRRLADGTNECIGIVNDKGEVKFTKMPSSLLKGKKLSYSAIESVLQKVGTVKPPLHLGLVPNARAFEAYRKDGSILKAEATEEREEEEEEEEANPPPAKRSRGGLFSFFGSD
jgi:hypothetical protein